MRLALLSNQRLNPWVNWSTLAPPLFAKLETYENVQQIAVPPLTLSHARDWLRVRDELSHCDIEFWIQPTARPAPPITMASLLNPHARKFAFAYDAFEPLLWKVALGARLQGLELLFVAYLEARDALRARWPELQCEWMPFGIDTDVFRPSDSSKPVFAFWMGRRYEPLHQALLQYCSARGLRYEYRVPGVYPTPEELGQMAGQSRYFIVSPPDLDNPKRTGSFSPLVMRYMEGLAAGARLLGVLPRSGEYQRLLPIDAICEVLPDGSDLTARLERDDESRLWEATAIAAATVRRDHSWARRAEQIYNRIQHGEPLPFQ